MNDRPPPPPSPSKPEDPATSAASMSTGGIYIRWAERLWQEQPDGSYLVWNEDARQWEPSTTQPPSERGQTISTRECPNCGRRVKTTLRSCPYCEHGLESAPPAARAEPTPAPAAPPRRRLAVSQGVLLVALVLVAALIVAVVMKRRSDLCANWKAGIRTYTAVAVETQALPSGMSEQEFRELNEDRFADTRPGGCE